MEILVCFELSVQEENLRTSLHLSACKLICSYQLQTDEQEFILCDVGDMH
jgi:hypothetical protein